MRSSVVVAVDPRVVQCLGGLDARKRSGGVEQFTAQGLVPGNGLTSEGRELPGGALLRGHGQNS
jgi:hypothetical protein